MKDVWVLHVEFKCNGEWISDVVALNRVFYTRAKAERFISVNLGPDSGSIVRIRRGMIRIFPVRYELNRKK